MLECHKRCNVLFLKPYSLKNFGPTTNVRWDLHFCTANAICCASSVHKVLPWATFLCWKWHTPSHNDKLFLTLILTGFEALGKLVWPDRTDLRSYHKLSMWNFIQWHDNTYSFWLSNSKTDCIFEGSRIIVHNHTSPIPFLLLTSSPAILFFHIAPNSGCSKTDWYLLACGSSITYTHTFPKTQPESLHTGGTTNLTSCGFIYDAIMLISRWLSNNWHKYVCHHPALMHALFFNSSHPSS